MSAVPPIYKTFEELSADKRFDRHSLEFSRDVSSVMPLRYKIRVMTPSTGDLAERAKMMVALEEFVRKHDLDSEVNSSFVTLTPRS